MGYVLINGFECKQSTILFSSKLETIKNSPISTGCYVLRNSNGDALYVGKSKNIRKRISQHLYGKSSSNILDIYSITFYETREQDRVEQALIANLSPIYNNGLTSNHYKKNGDIEKRKMIRVSEKHHRIAKEQAALSGMLLQSWIEKAIEENATHFIN